MNKYLVLPLLTGLLISNAAFAERQLTREEVIQVFTDVTFDGVYLPKNSHFSAYDAPDGSLTVVQSNGDKSGGRTWFVNEQGQRCATDPKWKNKQEWKDGRCFDVMDGGNGTYLQYENGKQTHIFSNFRRGNQL